MLSRTVIVMALLASASTLWAAEQPGIRFDLPPLVAAQRIETATQTELFSDDRLVSIELKLSSMIAGPIVPKIDQWLVRCQPRDQDVSIADYAPRTELASEIAGPIEIKTSNERSHSFGVALDGAYSHLARIHSGIDKTDKNIDSYQLQRLAPVQAVTAAGTINRGRGVYYKLRWTAQQVLEGEKVFHITLRVPASWRGSLIDVSVVAQTQAKSFGGLESEIRSLGAADFVVAAYLANDQQAADQARQLFDAENELRTLARHCADPPSALSLTNLFRQLAIKLDPESELDKKSWVDRLLICQADPHLDKEIKKLPMTVRVAVLDYVDARDEFQRLNQDED